MLMEAKMPFRFDYLNSTHCILRTQQQQQQQQNSWCLRFFFSFRSPCNYTSCATCVTTVCDVHTITRCLSWPRESTQCFCMVSVQMRLAYRVNFARTGALCWTHPSRMSRCQHFQMNTKNCNFIFIFFISFQSQISKRVIDFVQLHTFHYVERAALWRFTYIYIRCATRSRCNRTPVAICIVLSVN